MAIRIPTYEPHTQLDAGAQTMPRFTADTSIGRGLSSAGNALIQLGDHLRKKQDQFDQMQLNAAMQSANIQVNQIIYEENQKYDPMKDTPGTLHNRINQRVQQVYDQVYANAPDHLKPKVAIQTAPLIEQASNTAAHTETQRIAASAGKQLDQIKAQWSQAVKADPTLGPKAIASMRESVAQMGGSFSPAKQRELSRGYEDAIAHDTVEAFKAKKQFDAAAGFAKEYATGRDQTYGPGFRAGGWKGSDASGGDLDKTAYDKTFKGTPLEGKSDAVIAAAEKAGVPPALLAGVMAHETGAGKSKMLANNNNPGGVMDPSNPQQGMKFDSVEAGIDRTAQAVAKNYQQGGGTIPGMARTYAPPGAANDPQNLNPGWAAGVTRYTSMFGGTPRAADTGDSGAQKFAGDQNIHEPIAGASSIGAKVGDDSASRGRGAHQGNDIMAPVGTSVRAVKDGVVDHISKDNFGKDVIVLKFDDGTYARYMHMGSLDVGKGDRVKGGEQIGTSGSANGVAHLHFEAWNQQPNKGNVGLVEPSQVFGWSKGNLPSGKMVTAGGGQPTPVADATPRQEVPVVDTEGKKVVVDPATGQMTTEAKLAEKPTEVAGPMVGGMAAGPQEQATVPLPPPRPVLKTEGGSWLDSQLAGIDAARMKAQGIDTSMKHQLTRTLDSDISSRLNTGVPVKLTPDLQRYFGTADLTYEFIANKLGEGAAIKWEQDKSRADKFYGAGANMREMPEIAINERIRKLTPVEGSPDYSQQLDVYTHALKEKDKILTERDKDPAMASMQLPGVKAAYEEYLKNPTVENGQKLATLRMMGQDYLGIDKAVQTPLTNPEGARVAKGFMGKGSLDPAGAAAGAVNQLQKMFGGDEDMLKRGLATVAKQNGINENAAAQLSVALSEASKKPAQAGGPANAPTNQAPGAPNAPKSLFPTDPTQYDEFGAIVLGKEGAGYEKPPAVSTGEYKDGQEKTPSAERIKALYRDPGAESAKFDEEFGRGATAAFIQKQHELGLRPPVEAPSVASPDDQTAVTPTQVSPDQTGFTPIKGPDEEEPPATPEEPDTSGGG